MTDFYTLLSFENQVATFQLECNLPLIYVVDNKENSA